MSTVWLVIIPNNYWWIIYYHKFWVVHFSTGHRFKSIAENFAYRILSEVGICHSQIAELGVSSFLWLYGNLEKLSPLINLIKMFIESIYMSYVASSCLLHLLVTAVKSPSIHNLPSYKRRTQTFDNVLILLLFVIQFKTSWNDYGWAAFDRKWLNEGLPGVKQFTWPVQSDASL